MFVYLTIHDLIRYIIHKNEKKDSRFDNYGLESEKSIGIENRDGINLFTYPNYITFFIINVLLKK